MHSENSIRTLQPALRGRSGKLLIFRFTARGRRRRRLETTRTCKISLSIVSWNPGLSCGGNSAVNRQLATDGPHGVQERKPVGIFSGLKCRLVHQAAACEGLVSDFGPSLVVHGGIDKQQTLPFGTPEDVRRQVAENIEIFSNCKGHIVALCHNIYANTSTRNTLALYN